jgi:predicted Fe-Mo cluster-binding NifX family protein
MKIAIPVKMNKENPPVAPLFGKAKWFALIEDGKIPIQPNIAEGGRAVIEWLYQLNVDTIIMQEMGNGPYSMIQKLGNMSVYHSGFDRILLDDVLKKFFNDELPLLNDESMSEIIAHHESKHSHDNHHHADHHHH